jgi:predicted metal-dependent hydrolase
MPSSASSSPREQAERAARLAASLGAALRPDQPLRLKLDRRARRLRLALRDGQLELRAPAWIDPHEALSFIQRNRAWIDAQFGAEGRLGALVLEQLRLDPINGRIPLWGQTRRIDCQPGAARVDLSGEPIRIGLDPDRRDARQALRRMLLTALANALREQVLENQPELRARGALAPSGLRIRPLRSLWGSLSPRGAISLNLGLVFLPPRLADYVYAHELAHLEQRNHSPAYWRVVDRLYPDWRQARAELRSQHGLVQALLRELCA